MSDADAFSFRLGEAFDRRDTVPVEIGDVEAGIESLQRLTRIDPRGDFSKRHDSHVYRSRDDTFDHIRSTPKFHQIGLNALFCEGPLIHCHVQRQVSRSRHGQRNR